MIIHYELNNFTLYTVHSKVARGNLGLRYSVAIETLVPDFSPNSGGTCWNRTIYFLMSVLFLDCYVFMSKNCLYYCFSCCKSGSCVTNYLKELDTYSINTNGCGDVINRIIKISMYTHSAFFLVVILLEVYTNFINVPIVFTIESLILKYSALCCKQNFGAIKL